MKVAQPSARNYHENSPHHLDTLFQTSRHALVNSIAASSSWEESASTIWAVHELLHPQFAAESVTPVPLAACSRGGNPGMSTICSSFETARVPVARSSRLAPLTPKSVALAPQRCLQQCTLSRTLAPMVVSCCWEAGMQTTMTCTIFTMFSWMGSDRRSDMGSCGFLFG